MIINLDAKEMATLVLHMTISRKNVKRGFKSNYGTKEGREVLASYDEVKAALSDVLKLDQEHEEVAEGLHEVHFNIKEVDMLKSYLKWYNTKVEDSIGEKKIHQEDAEQIETLKAIENKVDELIVAYA